MYLRLGDFLVSCVAQPISGNPGTYSLGFPSDQVLSSRIVRLIFTGHDGVLPVDGDLPAPIVPHNSEMRQSTCPARTRQVCRSQLTAVTGLRGALPQAGAPLAVRT